MNARWIRGTILIVAVALLLIPAAALASKVFYSATDGKALITFAVKSGKKEKIVDFAWDGLKCSGDRFTGGIEDPVKIKHDRSFETEQPVDGTDLLAKLKGTVSKDAKHVYGRLKLKGECSVKVKFKAAISAG